jgi:catechol 2,3-dioxygenase-like lactoylglutathione lyase family enzyme
LTQPKKRPIDHISVAVRDLVIAERFYTAVLAPLGLSKVRDLPDAAIGFRQEVSRVLDQQTRGDGAGGRR